MKKKIAAALTAAVLCIALAGCGENQIPDLTSEQLQMIGEYTAITLMKYDTGNRSRLVELPPENEVSPAPGQTEASDQTETSDQPVGMRPTDDTPIVDSLGQTANGASANTPEEVLELPEGVRLEYVEYELCEAYPYLEGEDNFLTISAAAGKKLLVLHFDVVNNSEQDQMVNLQAFDKISYQITVNGSYRRRALTTTLLNDMAGFSDVVSAEESVGLVLVIEVEDNMAAELSSVSLRVKNDSKTCTIQLI